MKDNNQIRIFAQRLANNNKFIRDKALKMLKKHFKIRSTLGGCFDLDDMLNIWKGLFYSMYMSDKSLTQEDLAEDISKLVHDLKKINDKRCFVKAALQTFAREWHGIDVFRIDKMMMFVRRVLRQSLEYLKALNWNIDEANLLVQSFEDDVICPSDNVNLKPMGLKLHFCDIYLEELAKIGGESLDYKVILLFLQPYIKVIALSSQNSYVTRVRERIMYHLMKQSDVGIEYEQSLEGMPSQGEEDSEDENEDQTNNEDQMEHDEQEPMDEGENGNEDVEDDVLDPRAGEVDVYLPQLNVDYNSLCNDLISMGSVGTIKQQKRNLLYILAKQFLDIHKGIYPLRLQDEFDEKEEINAIKLTEKKKLQNLQNFEKKISNKYDIGKKRKRKTTNTTIGSASKSKNESMDVDEDEEEETATQTIVKKKLKRKNKKTKKNQIDPKILKKKMVEQAVTREKSIEEKLLSIRQKAGLPVLKEANLSPTKKRKSLDFSITDIEISVPSKKRKTDAMDCSYSTDEWSVQPAVENDKEKKKNMNSNSDLKVKEPKKITQFQSPWDEPLKEGEYEITVKSRKQIRKEKKQAKDKPNTESIAVDSPNTVRRRSIIINLKENKEHPFHDYSKSIRNSPSIPFNAEKKPKVSVLKPSPSPILVRKPILKVLQKSPSNITPKAKKLRRQGVKSFVLSH